jgi:hypothetical protein
LHHPEERDFACLTTPARQALALSDAQHRTKSVTGYCGAKIPQACLLVYDRLTLFATEGLRKLRRLESDPLMRIGVGHETRKFELVASRLISSVGAQVDCNRLGLLTKKQLSEYLI